MPPVEEKDIEVANFFDCGCHTPEHAIVFKYIQGKDYQEVYLTVFLSTYENLFKRGWTALKYFFGYKPQWGHFDCWTLRDEDLDRMITVLQRYKEDIKKNNPEP